MKKILSLLFFVAIAVSASAQVIINGAVQKDDSDDKLVFTFVNNSGKTISNCNFKLALPEGVSIKKNKKGKLQYETGLATEDMTFDVSYNENTGIYAVMIYKGEFYEEDADDVIIKLLLDGNGSGQATVSEIAFGDPTGSNICRPENFTVEVATAINGISADQTKSGVIYNLAGQRVSKANKGIYVVDGKKVAVSK